MNGPEQLTFDVPDAAPAPTHWECRGPKDWRPVAVVTRFGDSRGLREPVFPLVVTKPLGPRNVAIRREDGTCVVRPVRSLRRQRP